MEAMQVETPRTESTFRASRVQRLDAFRQIVYSGCWEDTDTELAALALPKGARVLSITASGSRSLGLLAADPAQVISVDLNPAQSSLLDLKRCSALGARSWEEHAAFLGALRANTHARRMTYARVRPHLSREARTFWDARPGLVERGVIDVGRQDRIVAALRPLAWGVLPSKKIRPLFEMDDLDAQARYFDAHIDTKAVRAVASLGMSKWALNWIYGKDLYEQSGFFSMGTMIFENIARHAHTRLFRENHFLSRVLLGELLDPRNVSSYDLAERSFEALRARAHVVEPVTAPLEDVLARLPDDSLDGFSFSDIFDWIEPAAFDRLMREVVRVAKDGARICYRVCLVERRPGPSLAGFIESDTDTARTLFARDRSCFYRDLFVGTVTKSARA